MAKIAVESGLNDVKNILQTNGHEVVSMDNLDNCACCVISGQDKNVMGIANAATKASVINAQGLSANQVLEQVNNKLS